MLSIGYVMSKRITFRDVSAGSTPATALKQDPSKRKKWAIWISVIVISGVVIISAVIAVVLIVLSRKRKEKNQLHLNQLTSDHLISPISFTEKDLSKLDHAYKGKTDIVEPSIFVAISSYRDPELCLTLRDLFEKAYNPDRVYVGIVEQNDPKDPVTCFAKNTLIKGKPVDPNHIRIISFHYKDAKGPTHARAICEGLWKQEEYYMMTDSHMRFEPGWDADLINMTLKSRRPRRTVITMYPEGFEREEKDGAVSYKVGQRRGWRYEQIKKFNEQGILEFESVTTIVPPPKKPLHVPMYGACFVFGHSDILRLVPFHPDTPYLFFGEEMFMAVRLLSHGFDLLGPTHSVCYHLWKREYRKTYWDHDVIALRDKSIQLIKDIMSGKVKDEKYGMGTVRSWQEIQDYLGVEFDNQKFTRPHHPWKIPKNWRELKDEFCVNC